VKDHPAVKRRYDRDCCEARSSGEPRFTNLASSIEHALQMLRSGVNIAGQYDYPVCLKPATTLSRKDWHSSVNRAVL
jgi:hypothetical protein